jgi:TfoX/Sxy family transcriptional regulator of competence genes
MATDADFVAYVCEQMRLAGPITCRKMFGEYAVYFDDRAIALVCDNQLFIKPVPAARALIGSPLEKPPYPGAKPHFLIDDKLEDPQWLAKLVRVTASEVPPKAPKKAAKKATPIKPPRRKSRQKSAGEKLR